MDETKTRLRCLLWLALVLAASVFPLWAGWRHHTDLNDDSYITLTYAKSLAAGQGWRFNGGSVALGTTTPLFTLVLAALARLLPVFTVEQLAIAWSVGCWMASGWLLWLGRRTFGFPPGMATLAGALLLLRGDTVSSLGMEASTLIFGLMLAAWLAGRDQPLAAGVAAGLLFLVRPEGLAMVPLVGGWLVWQAKGHRGGTLARFAVGAGLPLLLWAVYALATFGNVLPNSVLAKAGQSGFWPGPSFAERLFQQWLSPFAARYGLNPLLSLLWPLVGLAVAWALRQRSPLLLLVAWLGLFVGGYALLGAPGYWWYLQPISALLGLLLGVGVAAVGERGGRWRALSIVAALGLLVVTLRVSSLYVFQPQGDTRAATYRGVAAWLGANTEPTESIAFVEIGYLGYFSDNRIVDLVGLIEPRFTQNGARLNLAANFWQAEPDFLLYAPDFGWLLDPIVQDPRFPQMYRPVAELPSDHFATPLTVYARQ